MRGNGMVELKPTRLGGTWTTMASETKRSRRDHGGKRIWKKQALIHCILQASCMRTNGDSRKIPLESKSLIPGSSICQTGTWRAGGIVSHASNPVVVVVMDTG